MRNSTTDLQSHRTPSSIHHKPNIREGCVCAAADFFSDRALENFLVANIYTTIIDVVVSRARQDSLFHPAAVKNIKIICKTILFIYNAHINYNFNIY